MCAPGEYLEDGNCQSCPANSNSVLGSVGVSSCICNQGFSGNPGVPCTLIAYPTTGTGGCAAGYWAPANACQKDDYMILNTYACISYAKIFVASGGQGNNHAYCYDDGACTKCCSQCASFQKCAGLTPQPCRAAPPAQRTRIRHSAARHSRCAPATPATAGQQAGRVLAQDDGCWNFRGHLLLQRNQRTHNWG
jgi:hypothetical protein